MGGAGDKKNAFFVETCAKAECANFQNRQTRLQYKSH